MIKGISPYVALGVLCLGVLLGVGMASDQPRQDPAVKPSAAPAPRDRALPKLTGPTGYQVDPGASRVYVKVGAEGYGHVHGVLGKLASGRVVLGGPGELVFDMRTFVADLPEVRQALGMTKKVSASDQQKVTANMLGTGVLDAAHYPKAVFAIKTASPADGQAVGTAGRYQLDGEFTLHGVKRPLRLLAVVEQTDQTNGLRMRGSFAILQTQFGITPYSALGGLVRVADRLEISGDLVLLAPNP